MPLYRAVQDEELNQILETGTFQNPVGLESKYFSTSYEGAACYAQEAEASGTDALAGPYTISGYFDPRRFDYS